MGRNFGKLKNKRTKKRKMRGNPYLRRSGGAGKVGVKVGARSEE
jgi:hypothetical protein